MLDSLTDTKPLTIQTNYLWFLTLSFCMIIVLANWFDPRLITFFGLTTDAGTLVFPLTFMLSDLITEVYGYKFARRAMWCGFIFNAVFIIYGQIVIHMPSPDYPTHNALFDSLIMLNIRIIFASAVSYLCSEPLNSYVMAKSKIRMHGSLMGLRFVLSTAIASGVDSMIFTIIAFYGTLQLNNLISLAATMWLIKVCIEIAGLPISIQLARKLKAIEKMDIYDKNTVFNIFKLNTLYLNNDNKYYLVKKQ